MIIVEQERKHFHVAMEERKKEYIISKTINGYDFSYPFIKYSELAPFLENIQKICPVLNAPNEKINITHDFIAGIKEKIKNKEFFSQKEMIFTRQVVNFYRTINLHEHRIEQEDFIPLLSGDINSLLAEGFIIDSNYIKNLLQKNEEIRIKKLNEIKEKGK